MLSRHLLSPGRRTISARLTRSLATTASSGDGLIYNGSSYPFRWLRDSCQCPQCVHPSTRQKLHRTTDIPENVRPTADGVERIGDVINISWSTGHRSSYPTAFLDTYADPTALHQFHHDVKPSHWNKERISAAPDLFVSYADLQKPSGLLAATTQLTKYGLLFVSGVSNKEVTNDSCEARKLATLFGEIRETMYGDLWDVINIRNSTNIAYTNLFLGLHMDLL